MCRKLSQGSMRNRNRVYYVYTLKPLTWNSSSYSKFKQRYRLLINLIDLLTYRFIIGTLIPNHTIPYYLYVLLAYNIPGYSAWKFCLPGKALCRKVLAWRKYWKLQLGDTLSSKLRAIIIYQNDLTIQLAPPHACIQLSNAFQCRL
ncbi:uncharacterized protein LOC143425994 [Xylocopa sonorina]|uniref:uncharacterized protein LOC143425994 n=1 Tax=Xylocopa sonorina TaxID=1818115 RepID=UPI00403B14E3